LKEPQALAGAQLQLTPWLAESFVTVAAMAAVAPVFNDAGGAVDKLTEIAAGAVTVKVSDPVELGFSTDAAVMVTLLVYEFGAVYVIVAVSPFPELPELVELPNVPHAGIQALPPLVNVHVAPRNCWLLWMIKAVKTCCCPAGIDATWV